MSVSLARLRFLVVDDNTHAVNLVKTMLRGFGADRLHDAQTVAAAKQQMTAAPADIVILDYMLGSEEGVTFARWLQSCWSYASVSLAGAPNYDCSMPFWNIAVLLRGNRRLRS